jgi:alpha-L-fucosidase
VDRIQKFRDARLGMFIHWGSYCVKGFEASWPLVRGEISHSDYEALATRFNPQRYDPAAWAELAKAVGMRYAILTTKHHDGFALYDTQLSDYSAPNWAAGRDLIRPYVEAFRAAGIQVGFYFSLCDWHHPDYPAGISDPRPERSRLPQALPPGVPESIEADPGRWERYIDFMHGQVRELLTMYGPIDLIWFDGHWEHTAEEWRAPELVKMMRELQPDIIINDRLADPSLGDYSTPEQYVPVESLDRPWETCMTINETWAYNPTDQAYKPARELIATMAEVVSKGGNFLLNIGPTPEGEIPPEFASRLRVLGDWMDRNQESIFASGTGLPPGAYYGPSTGSEDALYLHVLGRPGGDVLQVRGVERPVTNITLLATGQPLEYDQHSGHIEQGLLRVSLPSTLPDPLNTVVKLDLGSFKRPVSSSALRLG